MMRLISPPRARKHGSEASSMPVSLNSFQHFHRPCLASWSKEGTNRADHSFMSSEQTDLRSIIARHEQEIDELQEHVKVLEDGHMKERGEAEIAKKMTHLEADLRLQELQESMTKERGEPPRKRGFFQHR
jgi:hypothetical protein